MRVGLISDIHGNFAALQAVLAHAHFQSVQLIWNLGDSVGYGANPDQVIRLFSGKISPTDWGIDGVRV